MDKYWELGTETSILSPFTFSLRGLERTSFLRHAGGNPTHLRISFAVLIRRKAAVQRARVSHRHPNVTVWLQDRRDRRWRPFGRETSNPVLALSERHVR